MSDSFGETLENREERKRTPKYRKTEFLKLDGEQVIRIIHTPEVRHYTHYISFAYLKCLGDDCPICMNNKKILYEHPEDYRDVRGWNPRRDRYYINVMDKTISKVCHECGFENKPTAGICAKCSKPLGDAMPLNKIKVLSGSPKLFEDIKVMSKGVKDDDDNRVDIRTYDWLLNTRGTGREKVTLVQPSYSAKRAGFLQFNPEELYDLEKAVIVLSPEEMLEVFKGTSLKDIFAARKAKSNSESDFFAPTEHEKELAGDRELADRISDDIGKLSTMFGE